MTFRQLAVVAVLSAPLAGARAAPADDAREHFQAIAKGDVGAITKGYADQARLEWVGGPLDGDYTGQDAIKVAWEKFAKAQAPLEVAVGQLEESTNPKGSTVTANVQFTGKAQPIKVRYVLTYRDGRITGETWQIDPKLATGAK